ncbi:hypothetical protein RN001_004006 [Aquatica leii]|uniref:Uncharacterized protein n=1 Tax=Aquatica leii TaxID=1421715 RepID=A0AAN7QC36_9COLE|nr:hypothetical protein RN001_004006 [Aquatica leii]
MDQDKKNMDPPDGGYGWIIIIACILITTCVAPFQQCFGLIYERPFREMDISATTISFILNLYNSIMCILAFTAGPLLKKWNFKQIALAGCFASCTGITLTVFANSLGFLIVTFCLLQGIGIGFITQSVSLAKNVYFKKRLTLAMTCSVTGTGLLPIVMPQITTYLLNFYGTRNTILIFAAISYHSVIGALLLRPIKNKKSTNTTIEDIFVVSQQHRNETQSLTNKNNSVCSKIYKLLDLELFKDRSFVILVIGLSISYVAELNFNLINPFVLSQLSHLSTKDVALAMSVQATGDICGRLFLPLISFKFKCPSKIMFVVTLIGSCVGRAVLVCFSDVRVVVISISILLGLAKGGRAVYQSLVLPEYVSIETLPVATGFVMILNGVLSLALGPLIGLIHDVTGTYAYSLHSVSVLSMFCVVLLLLDNLFQKIIRKKTLHIQTRK